MRKLRCDKADFTKNCGTTYKEYLILELIMFSIKSKNIIVGFSTEYYPPLHIKKFTIEDLSHSMAIQNPKSPASFRADECFRPHPVFKGGMSFRTIKSGLECGQWLSRKLRITLLMQ
jgi:hypothetical protein